MTESMMSKEENIRTLIDYVDDTTKIFKKLFRVYATNSTDATLRHTQKLLKGNGGGLESLLPHSGANARPPPLSDVIDNGYTVSQAKKQILSNLHEILVDPSFQGYHDHEYKVEVSTLIKDLKRNVRALRVTKDNIYDLNKLDTDFDKISNKLQLFRERYRRDHLTGALPRDDFFASIDAYLRRAIGSKDQVTFAMLDVDNLKLYNDGSGQDGLGNHPQGDVALKHFVSILRETINNPSEEVIASRKVRDANHEILYTLGRVGGDEFALAFPNITPEEAKILLEDFNKNLREHHEEQVKAEFGEANYTSPFNDKYSHFSSAVGITSTAALKGRKSNQEYVNFYSRMKGILKGDPKYEKIKSIIEAGDKDTSGNDLCEPGHNAYARATNQQWLLRDKMGYILRKEADMALYRAKNARVHKVKIYDLSMSLKKVNGQNK